MPKMVVFDLDFTLWRPELYQLSSGSPFKACSDGAVLTSRGERLDLFPAARTALRTLADAHVPVAIASRANEVAWAHEIMRLLRVDDRRTVADVVGSAPVVIQGGSKVAHLKRDPSYYEQDSFDGWAPLEEMAARWHMKMKVKFIRQEAYRLLPLHIEGIQENEIAKMRKKEMVDLLNKRVPLPKPGEQKEAEEELMKRREFQS